MMGQKLSESQKECHVSTSGRVPENLEVLELDKGLKYKLFTWFIILKLKKRLSVVGDCLFISLPPVLPK